MTGDLKAPGQLAEFWGRAADLDKQIAQEAAEGYCVDTLLADRRQWQIERDELLKQVAR